MTRGEKAASIRHEGVPGPWRHKLAALPAGAPDISTLSAAEQQAINNWLTYIHKGSDIIDTPPIQLQDGTANLSADALAKIVDYQAWLKGAAYLAWRDQNLIRREAQYRVTLVDAIEETITNATVPPSQDVTGAGANAPAGDIPASA